MHFLLLLLCLFMQAIVLGVTSNCWADNLDLYGGTTMMTCSKGPQPHFYTEKLGGHWWLCDPAGHGFFIKGVTNIGASVNTQQQNLDVPGAACYGAGQPAPCCTGVGTGPTCGGKYWNNIAPNPYVTDPTNPSMWVYNWLIEQIKRLQSWGFNTVADDSYALLWPTMTSSAWNTSDKTIPGPFRMPFDLIKNTTAYAFTNQAGCGLATSPIKDMLNGLTLTNQSLVHYNYADYFDPHYATCANGQANPANDSILQSATQGPHNDYLLYITLDEGNQTGFNDQGPDFPTINNAGVANGAIGSNAHAAWVTLNTAPTQSSATQSWGSASYSDHEVYSKVKFADLVATEYAAPDCAGPGTPFAACTGRRAAANGSVDPSCTGSPLPPYCMGDSYIGSSEMTNAKNRLNTAWGSNYSILRTSDSNCSSNLAGCLISNGACTGSGTPYSWCTGSGTGNATAYASWGTGTGLLDENGSCPAGGSCWVSTDVVSLRGETAAMQADLSTYLRRYVDQYYGTLTKAFRTYQPGVMLQMILGGWGAPPRKEVCQEASKYLDLPQLTVPEYCPTCTDTQQRVDFAAQCLGNKPWMTWEGFYANPDSSESQHAVSDNMATTQAKRATAYQQMISLMLNSHDAATGTYHVVGFYWWDMFDENSEGLNWGLLSVNDNPYDGKSATIGGIDGIHGKDEWGYRTGSERGNYGDFISGVKAANDSVTAPMHSSRKSSE